jgi:hypothetical protein
MPVFSFEIGEAIDDIIDLSCLYLLAVHMFSNKYYNEVNKLINQIKSYNYIILLSNLINKALS